MKVKVWNEGPVALRERFKGQEIEIQPGEYLEMRRGDAIAFKSQFKPLVHDGELNPLQSSIKKLRIEGLYPVGAAQAGEPLVNHATGEVAKSPEELEAMQKANRAMLTADARRLVEEQEKSAALNDEVEALKAKIAAMEAGSGKRGPGRPRKEQSDRKGHNPES